MKVEDGYNLLEVAEDELGDNESYKAALLWLSILTFISLYGEFHYLFPWH